MSDVVRINGCVCTIKDEWDTKGIDSFSNYLIGQAVDNPEFYYAYARCQIIKPESWQTGKYKTTFEYDSCPTKEKVESDMEDFVAEQILNEREAEFGADGRLAQERGL